MSKYGRRLTTFTQSLPRRLYLDLFISTCSRIPEALQRNRALSFPILPDAVTGRIVPCLTEPLRLADRPAGIPGLPEHIERDHRLPEDQLSLVGPIDERAGEWQRVLELGRLRVEQMVPHPRYHRAHIDVAGRQVSCWYWTSRASELAAVHQLAAPTGGDGFDDSPIHGVEVEI